jgi:uncharacterized membrane protein
MPMSYRVFRVWLWEILSAVVAICLIIIIAVLLASYDAKPTPDWGAHLNFNALLALLSTILRAMLVVIITQIISQKKWEWYRRDQSRPLSDLQLFDSGSRGSFGALLLIPTVILKDVVTLIAAILLITSFLVGPFVQQASRTTSCSFPESNPNAKLPYAHYIPRHGGYLDPINAAPGVSPSPDLIVAILSSVTAPNSKENQISPSCATGECTFPYGDPDDLTGINLTTHSTVGMCNKCIDVAALVTTTNDTRSSSSSHYTLPNGYNVSNGAGRVTDIISPSPSLDWLGERLTPELRAMSRWAYVNATYLAIPVRLEVPVAAVCVLYPCLRTYTATVSKNQLFEKEIRSEFMQVDMTYEDDSSIRNKGQSANTLLNRWGHYVAIKSPCRVDGQVYEMSRNMSSYSGATKLSLFDFTDGGGQESYRYTYRNITAPEQCIYRQHARLVAAIARFLSSDVFHGACDNFKGGACYKGSAEDNSMDAGMASTIGMGTVLRTLRTGNASFSNTTRWFDSFATAMTNKFRLEYGAAKFNSRIDLPLGEIQGLTWQTTSCVSMHVQWLIVPISLTVITVLLGMWTIAVNFHHRHERPIWKDSLFPLIFYGHKIESQELAGVPNPTSADHTEINPGGKEDDRLLEVHEMGAVSRQIPVIMRWSDDRSLGDSDNRAVVSSFALQRERASLQLHIPQDLEVDSLLETTNIRAYRASSIDFAEIRSE